MQLVSSHHFLQDHCKDKHPTFDAQKCAFVYAHMKPWEEFDQPLSAIHHDAKPEEANDYTEHYLNEEPDALHEVDGEFFDSKEHYEFEVRNREVARGNIV